MICSPCQAKLDNFKLFWLQFKTNSNLLNVFRSKQILQQQVKTEVKAEENKNKVLDNFDNEIRQRLGTLTPLDFSLNGKSKVLKIKNNNIKFILQIKTESRYIQRKT